MKRINANTTLSVKGDIDFWRAIEAKYRRSQGESLSAIFVRLLEDSMRDVTLTSDDVASVPIPGDVLTEMSREAKRKGVTIPDLARMMLKSYTGTDNPKTKGA